MNNPLLTLGKDTLGAQSKDLTAASKYSLRIDEPNVLPTKPIGTWKGWHSAKIAPPDGWLLCNGQKFDQNAYPDFVAYLKNEGLNASIVPDFRNRFPRASGTNLNIGQTQEDAIRNNSWYELLVPNSL